VKAEILSVGTELLLGQIVDTNSNYLAQQLPALGIDLYFVSQVGDNLGRLAEAFRRGLERSDLVISTGGLGPTEDDLTREAISEVLGEQMQVQPELERELRAFFERRGRTMPDRNVKQAATIPSATVLPNPVGTAPGWWVEVVSGGMDRGEGARTAPGSLGGKEGKIVVAMPGVPNEMRKMWEEQVVPRLAQRAGAGIIVSRTLKLVGIGESHAEEALGELTHSANPTLATYAKSDGIYLRLTAKASTREEAERLLAQLEPRVQERVKPWFYGTDNASFPAVVGTLLMRRGLSLATAESATSGHLAALITDAPGASEYFRAGYVAYSRAAKEALGVPAAVIDQHGTIAEETSRALARAAREHSGAEVAIATTGVAGPDSAEGKPVGTLHIAVDISGAVTVQNTRYSTTPGEFKRRGSLDALYLLWRSIVDSH
jgi:nicotinamide-nucleotide amidase